MSLELCFLGRPSIFLDGVDLTAQLGDKPMAVLAFLALQTQPLSRKKLAGTFWSEKTDQAANYRLRHTLWELRRLLGEQFIASDSNQCRFEFTQAVRVDVVEFTQTSATLGIGIAQAPPHLEHLGKLRALAQLYRGDLLDGTYVPDAPLFDEWLLVEREKYSLLYLETLWNLALTQHAGQIYIDAAKTLTELIQLDPLHERSYRALMSVYAQHGDRAGALRVYEQCARTLANELGVAPCAETQRLRERIARGTADQTGIELEEAIAQAETALAEGRAEDARRLLHSAKQVIRNFFQ